ncbi:AMIN domain-containing protein [Synechococcus sp. PCC 7336]|uniref:AMIN domain-containing protein n=1 Tax=Synechococcus sp. PCC 7336 TaxID=195250 RepID=UPI00138B13F0|nr:AMIN domain-containing protein [Synechococcus sp. PCC 7336]
MIVKRCLKTGLAAGLALSLPLTAASVLFPSSQSSRLAIAANESQDQAAIRAIDLQQQGDRLTLEIALAGTGRPQVFFTQQGNAWVGDIANVSLDVNGERSHYRQDNPAPGIRYLEARQISNTGVQIRLLGDTAAPQGLLSTRSSDLLVFDFDSPPVATIASVPTDASDSATVSDVAAGEAPLPESSQANEPAILPPLLPPRSRRSESSSTTASASNSQGEGVLLENGLPSPIDTYLRGNNASSSPSSAPPSRPNAVAASTATPSTAAAPEASSPTPAALPPTSVAQGTDTTPEAQPIPPPLRQRLSLATAPPVGDIVTGDIRLTPPIVDLGSRETVTLTLKDAPVADVLSLLVRRAGLDVVLNDVPADATVSLDVNSSPLQDVFGSLLQLNQLQSERVGQTVFIGNTLPGVQQETLRTFRLNQAFVFETTLQAGGIEPTLGDLDSIIGEDIEIPGVLDTLLDMAANLPPLDGVQLFGDERTNTITAIGTPFQLDLISAQISQLDVRRRQAMLDFKLVDVILDNNLTLDFAGSFQSGNFGLGFFLDPAFQPPLEDGSSNFIFDSLGDLATQGIAEIEVLAESDRFKILADPKVFVSDGGFSTVTIGDEVIVNVEFQTDPATGVTTETAVIGNVGVTLVVRNVRIDDNGFVTLDLSPQVSSPSSTEIFAETTITLLSQRTLNSQQLRMRDGETLLISGLIQDTDLVTVDKVPILGDIPLLGALFRQSSTENERREVVLLMTPYILKENT